MNAPVEKHRSSDHVLKTPIWITVIRGFQVLVSIIILALAARLMHDAYLDEEGLALAISLITWFVVAYILVTEKVRSFHSAYHIIAVLVLDGLMIILWLATWAAVAARRATFTVDVSVDGCFDDGSVLDSKTCFRKRGVILFKSGAAMLSAIAGLGALVWLLFIATFVWTILQFLKGRKNGRFAMSSSATTTTATPATGENYQMEPKPVDPNQQQPQQQYQGQYPVQPQQQYQGQYPVQPDQQQHQGQYPMQPQQQHQGQYPAQPQQQHQGQYPPPAGTYPQGQYQQTISPVSGQGPYSPPGVGYPQDHQQAYNANNGPVATPEELQATSGSPQNPHWQQGPSTAAELGAR